MLSYGQGLSVEAQVTKQTFTKLSEFMSPNPPFLLLTHSCQVFCHSEKQNEKAENN